MSDCKKIHPLLPLDVDGGLSPSDKALVDKHLEECAAARHEMDQLVQMRLDLRNLPEPHLPQDLHSKIMGRLVNDERRFPLRLNFWARYSWVAAAAAVLAFIILNPFTGEKETLMGPIAQRTYDKEAAGESRVASSDKIGTLAAKRQPSGESNYAPGMPTDDSLSHKPFALAKKAKRSKSEPKEAPKVMADASVAGGAASGVPQPMVMASKPTDKDQLETETYSKRMEASEVAAVSPALPAAAPPARKKLEETKASTVKVKTASVPPAASSVESLGSAEDSLNEPQEPQDTSALSWRGTNSPFRTETTEALTDEPAFRSYWQALQPGQALPNVDFTKQAVVVLLAGEKPTAGYSISVTTLEEQENRVAVHYLVVSPPKGAVVAQVLTRPWSLQVIPKPAKPVVFIRN